MGRRIAGGAIGRVEAIDRLLHVAQGARGPRRFGEQALDVGVGQQGVADDLEPDDGKRLLGRGVECGARAGGGQQPSGHAR